MLILIHPKKVVALCYSQWPLLTRLCPVIQTKSNILTYLQLQGCNVRPLIKQTLILSYQIDPIHLQFKNNLLVFSNNPFHLQILFFFNNIDPSEIFLFYLIFPFVYVHRKRIEKGRETSGGTQQHVNEEWKLFLSMWKFSLCLFFSSAYSSW